MKKKILQYFKNLHTSNNDGFGGLLIKHIKYNTFGQINTPENGQPIQRLTNNYEDLLQNQKIWIRKSLTLIIMPSIIE